MMTQSDPKGERDQDDCAIWIMTARLMVMANRCC